MFAGYATLTETMILDVLARTSAGTPVNLDALPTFRVYGPDGLLSTQTGTCAFKDTGSVTGATNASPIVITSVGHGLTTGTRVTITGVGGNTGANGTWKVTRVDADTFSLDTSTGTGAYTSGGTWNTSGLYKLSLTVSAANGYEAGVTYSVLVSGAVSATAWAELVTFIVG